MTRIGYKWFDEKIYYFDIEFELPEIMDMDCIDDLNDSMELTFDRNGHYLTRNDYEGHPHRKYLLRLRYEDNNHDNQIIFQTSTDIGLYVEEMSYTVPEGYGWRYEKYEMSKLCFIFK